MLRSVSKRAFRVWSAETLLGTLREAVGGGADAADGTGQHRDPDRRARRRDGRCRRSTNCCRCRRPRLTLDIRSLEALAHELRGAKRPLLWLGGGARGASVPVRALAEMGFGVVSSAAGRGVLPEDRSGVARFIHDGARGRSAVSNLRCDDRGGLALARQRDAALESAPARAALPDRRRSDDARPLVSGEAFRNGRCRGCADGTRRAARQRHEDRSHVPRRRALALAPKRTRSYGGRSGRTKTSCMRSAIGCPRTRCGCAT